MTGLRWIAELVVLQMSGNASNSAGTGTWWWLSIVVTSAGSHGAACVHPVRRTTCELLVGMLVYTCLAFALCQKDSSYFLGFIRFIELAYTVADMLINVWFPRNI